MGDTATASGDVPRLGSSGPLRQTALIDSHRRLGAKLVGFGGWEMPLAYGQGTIAEHRACRHDSVIFDVSHLGTVRVEGTGSFERLQATLTNDLTKVAPGGAQYTHLLAEDGSVVDDIIVWWVDEGVFDVMPNASNTERVLEAVGGEDTTDRRCIIAVQGPHARTRLAAVAPDAAAVPRFGVIPVVWEGVPCLAAGTGYTGEDGLELCRPGRRRRSALGGPVGHRDAAGRPRSPGHAPAGGRPPAARTRAGTGHHPIAGRAELGGGLEEAPVPGPCRARGRA